MNVHNGGIKFRKMYWRR